MAVEKKEIKLKGDKALLLAEACKLNKEKKKAETRISEIKELLGFSSAAKYLNDAGDTLDIAESDNWSEIPAKKVYDYLKSEKLLSHFPNVVKVNITELKKVIPEITFNKWRKKGDAIIKWTFK